jgi:hypothetical protein
VDEIFRGITPESDGYYSTTLSNVCSLISSKIDQEYYGGEVVKKILSFFDLSCSSFCAAQSQVPKTSGRSWGISKSFGRRRPNMGGGSGGNKTKRRSMRNERRGRNNSKIKNRISRTRRTKRTRKNSRS